MDPARPADGGEGDEGGRGLPTDATPLPGAEPAARGGRLRSFARGRLRTVLLGAACLVGRPTPLSMAVAGGLVLLALGLRVWARGSLRINREVSTGGPYRFVRHPFYLAALLLDAGICAAAAEPWLAAVFAPAWFAVYLSQIAFEERTLAGLFGERFEQYRARVPALLPVRGAVRGLAASAPFSWGNPSLAQGIEYARGARALAAPLLVYVAAAVRQGGLAAATAGGAGLALAGFLALTAADGLLAVRARGLRGTEGAAPGAGSAWRDSVLLGVPALALFVLLALRPPTGSDARYVEAAREMAETGDWVVPRLDYAPYFEKPVLLYWLGALARIALGDGNVAVRAPSIAAAVASVLLCYAMGRELRGPRFGLAAGALLASMAMFALTSGVLLSDTLLAACLSLAWYAFLRHERAPGGAWEWVFWAALGAATLAKGPVALVVAGASLGTFLAVQGRLSEVRRLRPVAGLGVLLLCNLPWWGAVAARDPRFVEFFFLRENLRAFFDGTVHHPAPSWFYVPVLLAGVFPWTLLALGALWTAGGRVLAPAVAALVRRRPPPPADRARLYAACMFFPPFLFFSVSGAKLGTYLLPLLPAVALLAADFAGAQRERPRPFLRWSVVASVVLVAGACALFAPAWLAHRDLGISPEGRDAIVTVAVVGMGAILAGGVAVLWGRVVPGLVAAGLASTALLAVLGVSTIGAMVDDDASALAADLARVRRPGETVVVDHSFAQDYTVELALRDRVAILGHAREMGMGMFTEATPPAEPLPADPYLVDGQSLPGHRWLYTWKRLESEWRGPARLWFLGEPGQMERLRRDGLPVHVLCRSPRRVVATNLPPGTAGR